MNNAIREVLLSFKKELEANFLFDWSEIRELPKPTMMGKNGINFSFNTKDSGPGLVISFWNTGIFEIGTDFIDLEEPPYFISHAPDGDFYNNYYPEKEVKFLITKINDLIVIINEKYNVNLNIIANQIE